MKVQKNIEKLQKKVNRFSEKITEDIHGICEQMEYQDSSRFSYNIDRLKMFVEELNNFQIKGK